MGYSAFEETKVQCLRLSGFLSPPNFQVINLTWVSLALSRILSYGFECEARIGSMHFLTDRYKWPASRYPLRCSDEPQIVVLSRKSNRAHSCREVH